MDILQRQCTSNVIACIANATGQIALEATELVATGKAEGRTPLKHWAGD